MTANCGIKNYDLSVDGNESTLFTVEYFGEIIGSCMLFLDGWIQDFHVSEKHHRSGIGTALFESLEKVAKQKGIEKIEGLVSSKNTALNFWLKKGFSSVVNIEGNWITKTIPKK